METANDHGDGSSTGIRQREGCHALNPGSEPSTLPTRIKNHENQPRYRIEFFNGIGGKLPLDIAQQSADIDCVAYMLAWTWDAP